MINRQIIIKIIIAAAVLAALGLGYQKFFGQPANPVAQPGLVATGYLAGNQQEVTDEFLNILNSLEGLQLKGDLFGTDFFRSLNDAVTILPQQTPGRPNPFAPIGVAAKAVSTSTSPASLPSARDQLFRQLGS